MRDFASSEPDKGKKTDKIPSNRVPLQDKGHFDAYNSMNYSLQSMLIIYNPCIFLQVMRHLL